MAAHTLQAEIAKMFSEREERLRTQLCTPGNVGSWEGYQRTLAALDQVKKDRSGVEELLQKFFVEGEDT